MVLAWNDVVSIGALIISIGSAFFSWRSAAQAKYANQISVHEYQTAIYKSFTTVFNHVKKAGAESNHSIVMKLEISLGEARVYLPKKLLVSLSAFYEAASKIRGFQASVAEVNSQFDVLTRGTGYYSVSDPVATKTAERLRVSLAESEKGLAEHLRQVIELGSKTDIAFISRIEAGLTTTRGAQS
jgi:hypothetical protein